MDENEMLGAADSDDDRAILAEVYQRYEECQNFEADARSHSRDDWRFYHADAYNHNQWDANIYAGRANGDAPRPCLTINKAAAHIRQALNSCKQNQMGVKVVATGFGASALAATTLEGIIRHIESQSNAQQNAYGCAMENQFTRGRGWVHIKTDWVKGNDTFDQDFYIEAVPDPDCVMSDPACREPDHSDMQWAMLIDEMPKAEFLRLHPDHADDVGATQPMSIMPGATEGWVTEETVRVCRYYRRNEEKDTLWAAPVTNPQTGVTTIRPMRESEMDPDLVNLCKEIGADSRPIIRHHVQCFLIAGDKLIEKRDTVFRHIPLVPWIGVEYVDNGKVEYHGMVRSMLDPQRMYNYSASSLVEGVASQTVAPWLADARAIEGHEDRWADANVSRQAVLVYNTQDLDSAQPIQPPQRIDPPQSSQGHANLMMAADNQLQAVTGQYQAELGAPGNEKSGRAINERQRQSDTANYHYTDNQGMALRLIGRILIDAIPMVYDVQRAVQVLGADGTMTQAVIDPSQGRSASVALPDDQPPPQGMSIEQQMKIQGAILAINPAVGRYSVDPDVGPAFATQRQETMNALMQVLQAAPALMPQIGDLVFQAADFPLADEIAERLRPISDNPAAQHLQQQLQQAGKQIQQLQQQLKDKSIDQGLRADKQRHDQVIDLMDAQSDQERAQNDRMAAIGSIDPEALRPVLFNLVREILAQQGTPNAPIPQSAPAPLEQMPSTNPPGGMIHAPNPTTGAIQA